MFKSKFGMTLGLVLICLGLVTFGVTHLIASSGGQQSSRQGAENPTMVQEGVMSAKQAEHSKLYKQYRAGQKLSDITEKRGNQNVKTDADITIGPPLPDLSPYGTPTTTATILRAVACEADAVIISSVRDKSSQLTEDKDFIFTDYQISIEEVLKDDKSAHIEPNTVITVTGPGGAILYDGRKFSASVAALKPFAVGGRYLLFLKFIPATSAYRVFDGKGDYQLLGDRVFKLTAEHLPKDVDGGADLSSFMSEVRNALVTPCSSEKGGSK